MFVDNCDTIRFYARYDTRERISPGIPSAASEWPQPGLIDGVRSPYLARRRNSLAETNVYAES